jgi:GT2 family glycosyltransferase/glycosyltransferase involved in cell wall biosynthesis
MAPDDALLSEPARRQRAKRRPSLTELYAQHRTKVSDKWSSYLRLYDHLFSHLRDRPISLLEIGVQNGGSLELWAKYFSRARVIVGCDVDEACAKLTFDDARIQVVVGDVVDDDTLDRLRAASPEYAIIIDDGSHRSSDVIRAFALYFPLVAEGGCYVVEDVHCSYWAKFEGGLYHPWSAMSFFKRLADVANREHWGVDVPIDRLLVDFRIAYDIDLPTADFATVASVSFHDSVCIVTKRRSGESSLGERVVAGAEASVSSAPLAVSAESLPIADESTNPWAASQLVAEEVGERLEAAVRQRNVTIDRLRRRAIATARAMAEMRGDVEASREEAVEARKAAEHLRQALKRSERRLSELKAKTQRRESDMREMGERLHVLEERLSRLAEDNGNVRREIRTLASVLDQRESELTVALNRLGEWHAHVQQTHARSIRPAQGLLRAIAAYLSPNHSSSLARVLIRAALQGGSRGLSDVRRLLVDHFVIVASGSFDATYYRDIYPDVTKKRIDPLVHYLAFGADERRNPSAHFDTGWYIDANPDVKSSRMNPYAHYVRFGAREGRVGLAPVAAQSVGSGRVARRAESPPVRHGYGLQGARGTVLDAPPAAQAIVDELAGRVDDLKRDIAAYAQARARRRKSVRPRVAVFTAIAAGYDSVKPPANLDPRLDYILFTDAPVPDIGVWDVRPMTYHHAEPARSARYVKTHPHVLLADYDIAVWLDSNLMIAGNLWPFVERFLASGEKIGAIPHPFRTTLYDEVTACARQAKADPQEMHEQAARYASLGFTHEDLMETGFMVFDLRATEVSHFLNAWWSEIDRHTHRDQLSVNFALASAGLAWHRLVDRPASVRTIPEVVYFPHDRGDGITRGLLTALSRGEVDPYASGPPYADVVDSRVAAAQEHAIDVVVCVHNALAAVEECLGAVERHRSVRQRLIIVDDGSDARTADYLASFSEGRNWVTLLRNDSASGYTKAANRGIAASTGDLVVLLNSDAVVTERWADKLADAVFTTPGAGIVGPLSNAASHQSIPDHRGTSSQSAVNVLPPGKSPDDLNRECERWTIDGLLPRVPLVHGFCFGITRAVINVLGGFDDARFPRGYGEENDYCLRAVDAGFGCVVATHTYVYHSKSKSFQEQERVALMRAGAKEVRRLHGERRVNRAVKSMDANPLLTTFREKARRWYAPQSRGPSAGPKRVAALIPVRGDGLPEATGYIRVLRPLTHPSLSSEVQMSLSRGGSRDIADADIILVQRDAIRSPSEAERLVDDCRKHGRPLIFEIDDDLFHLPSGHPAASRFGSPAKDAMEIVARHAHAVTVSTRPLQKVMAAFNERTYVVPNALDERLWVPQVPTGRQKAGEVRLLYVGTRTHDDDLALLLEPLKMLRSELGARLRFVVVGGFSAAKPLQWAEELSPPPAAAQSYERFAAWLPSMRSYDVALAPLANTVFNESKSYIKFLDYAMCGFTIAVSDVEAYAPVARDRENAVVVANSTEAWASALVELLDKPDWRYELALEGQRQVLAMHTLGAQALERRALWQEIIDTVG